MRRSLANAKTTDEVSSAFKAEAKTITGHDIEADFSGGDVQLSKEHSEGILRSLEAHPNTQLGRVGTYGPGGKWNNYTSENAYAVTESRAGPERLSHNGQRVKTDAIFFNNAKSGHVADTEAYRSELKEMRQDHHSVISTPQHVAIHETGHVYAEYGGTKGFDSTAKVQLHMYQEAARTRQNAFDMVEKNISRYAAFNQGELTAEIFADTVINGSKASALSKQGMAILKHEHDAYIATIGG